MSKTYRTFTREELIAAGVVEVTEWGPTLTEDPDIVVYMEPTQDSHGCATELVWRMPDGSYWSETYSHGTDGWGDSCDFDAAHVRAFRVEPREITITRYMPVQS